MIRDFLYKIVLFFRDDIEMTKRLIRERIGQEAEGIYENARAYEYVSSKAELSEDLTKMSGKEKEMIRIEMLKDMEKIRDEIYQLWELLIFRTAKFQVAVDSSWKIALLAAIICLLFGFFMPALVLTIFSEVVWVFSHLKHCFQIVMYVVAGTWWISDELYLQYEEYGRREASLYLADYRHFSTDEDDSKPKSWIFTSSHKTTSP